jgi:GT2 family glycosyltransferase
MKQKENPSPGKQLSVVILNWNGEKLLQQFLPSVLEHTPSSYAEIVVADNGSTDNSLELLATRFPAVRVIAFDRNYGFAGGYNKALEEIGSEYAVLLNSDVEVTAGWTEAPLSLLKNRTDIACVQPIIRSEREKGYFEYAGAAGGYIDKYGYPFCRGRVFHVVEKDCGQYDAPADLLWASGACLFIRTAVYKENGGLDPHFFAHQEEIDFCWRIRSRGYRLVCTPASVVYHVGGGTLKKENPRKTFLNFRNNLLMLYKNLPEKELKPVMRVRFFLDYIAAARMLLSGQAGNALAVGRARKAFRLEKGLYKEIREKNLLLAKGARIPEILNASLLFLFYLKGKKSFHQISPFFQR